MSYAYAITLPVMFIRPIITALVIKLKTAVNVHALPKRIRKALKNETAAAMGARRTGYQALKTRSPSKVVLSVSCIFERRLSHSGSRFDRDCAWIPLFCASYQLRQVLTAAGVLLAGYMARVVGGIRNQPQYTALHALLQTVLDNMRCDEKDRRCVLELASNSDNCSPPSNSSPLEQLRGVIRKLGTKHRDAIYLLRMESVGREPGFREFVAFVERLLEASRLLGSDQLRQRVVPRADIQPSVVWTENVVTLLDSGSGVHPLYNDFMQVLADKSGAMFHPAPLKSPYRLAEKLWLRRVHDPEFQQGDCSNVFDVVRGMLVCPNVAVLSMCATLLASCDETLNWGLQPDADKTDSPNALEPDTNDPEVPAAQAAGIRTAIRVLRVKNRFARPTPGGWADVLIKWVELTRDPGMGRGGDFIG